MRRKIVGNILVVLVTFIILFTLVEFIFRIFFPQQLIILDSSKVWIPKDTLGWAARPLANTQVNTGERTVIIRTDEDGFRIDEPNAFDRKVCDKSILYIGDSYLQAIQVEENQTLPAVVRKQLKIAGLESCYDNAGVMGYDPNQYLINLKRILKTNTYDLVIVNWFLENDCVDSTFDYLPAIDESQLKDVNFSRFLDWRQFGVNVLRPLNEWSERRFHAYVYFKGRFKRAFAQVSDDVQYMPDQFLTSDPNPERWTITEQIMRQMKSTCDAYETAILFFLIPARYQTATGLWQAQFRADHLQPGMVDRLLPNKMINGFQDLPIVDLTRVFEQSNDLLYGMKDNHFSPAGHQAAATVLLPYIKARLH